MRALIRFDPWAELEKLRGPVAKAATGAKVEPALAILATLAEAASRISPPEKALSDPPVEWLEALSRIEERSCPQVIPKDRWRQITVDARYVVRHWSSALALSGWSPAEIFGAHRSHPLVRFDAAGLCLLLQGRKIALVLECRVLIRISDDVNRSYWRGHRNSESVMLWDLS